MQGESVIDVTERQRQPRLVAVAVMALTALLAGACGSSSDSGGGDTPAGVAGADVTLAAEGPPKLGGSLGYGLEAETNGYNPTKDRFAISGTIVGLAIYDPLMAYDENYVPRPYLAESMTPNADYTSWTIKVRPGITFHNGEALDGQALVDHFKQILQPSEVSLAYQNIVEESIQVDPTDPLAATMQMKTPWAAFPVFLTGQGGLVIAPEMAANRDSSSLSPIGTGPFMLEGSWAPDAKNTLVRNPNYWRTDADGTKLPYLESVSFQAIPNEESRAASLESGGLQMIHSTNSVTIKKFREQAAAGEVQTVEDRGESEESFIMLNTVVPPFDDIRARQALAYATNQDQVLEVVELDVRQPAKGIFTNDNPVVDTSIPAPYPEYDPAKAQELVDQYEAEKGPLSFRLENSGADDRTIQLLKSQWEQVGIDAQVNLTSQDTYIQRAVQGDFQAFEWRQFGSPDPDYDYLWWHSSNAGPVGGIALNFARNANPEIDAALDTGRTSSDPEERRRAYGTVQQKINEDVPYIWLSRTIWMVVARNNVRGITNGPLPGGEAPVPIGGPGGFGGVTFLTQTWLTS